MKIIGNIILILILIIVLVSCNNNKNQSINTDIIEVEDEQMSKETPETPETPETEVTEEAMEATGEAVEATEEAMGVHEEKQIVENENIDEAIEVQQAEIAEEVVPPVETMVKQDAPPVDNTPTDYQGSYGGSDENSPYMQWLHEQVNNAPPIEYNPSNSFDGISVDEIRKIKEENPEEYAKHIIGY